MQKEAAVISWRHSVKSWVVHFLCCSALTFYGVLLTGLPWQAVVFTVLMGGALLEVYQWFCEPWYRLKQLDTAVDLLANALGCAAAVGVIG